MFEGLVESKKDFFGLDIGYNSMKVVALKKSGKSFNLIGCNNLPIFPECIQKNGILKKAEISNIIREAVKGAKPRSIQTRRVVSGLPESLVFSKVFKLPLMKKEELEKAIPYEAADFFPVPINEMNLDWQILNSKPVPGPLKGEVEVLVVGATKLLVKDFMEVTANAGLDLIALETKPLASARAVLVNPNGLTMLADIGAESTCISIADDNMIKNTVTVKIGGNSITRDIMTATNTDLIEAEKIKISGGLELTNGTPKDIAIIKNLQIMTSEMTDMIKYYQTRVSKASKITEILLSGGGAELLNIDKFIHGEMNIATRIADPWAKIKVRPNDAVHPADALKYTTAIGLAMREI